MENDQNNQQPALVIHSQYIKDLSLEAPMAPEIFREMNKAPEVHVDINMENRKLDDGSYYYEGRMGSTMKTAWFDYSIDSAYYTTDEIGGYSASEGNELVVVELTLKNTFEESVPMYYGDFELEWGDGDDEYTYSITDEIMDDQYPEQYDLKVNETRTGYLVFEAPEGTEDFSIGFVEYYENDTEGNGFWVYFTADEK